MELRAYQLEALRAVLFQWRTVRRTLLVLPTGTGKTVVFSHLTKRLADAGKRVLILAHREELIDQAIDKLHRATGIFAAKEMAQHQATRSADAVVASVQTMTGARLQSWPADHFDVVIIDEAHHTLASTYMAILEHFAGARLLGVTATPDRGDKKGLGQVYESIAYQYRLGKAIKDGYLSPVRALTLPLSIDVSKVKTQAGDYSARDAGDALAPYLDQIADAMSTHCAGRKTVAFLPLIQTSQTLAHNSDCAGCASRRSTAKAKTGAKCWTTSAPGAMTCYAIRCCSPRDGTSRASTVSYAYGLPAYGRYMRKSSGAVCACTPAKTT